MNDVPLDLSSAILSRIPIGAYRLDADDNIIYVNRAWLDLHGFQNFVEVVGKNINMVYARPAETAQKIKMDLVTNETLQDGVFEFKRPWGEHFWASLYLVAITDDSGHYQGCEGIVLDATERKIHRRIMRAIPVGYYAVEVRNATDIITYCNQAFADMFGFSSAQEAVGVNISCLYRHSSDYESFHNRIDLGNENSVTHQLEVQTIDQRRIFWIEANVRVERNERGKPIGRVGVIRDLAQDAPLEKLRQDLGNVLHTFTTGLITIGSDIKMAKAALDPSPFAPAPVITAEQIYSEMQGSVTTLRRSLILLEQALVARGDLTALQQELQKLITKLDEAEKTELLFRPHALYFSAVQIAAACQNALESGGVPRQPLKQVRQEAQEIMRILALARLQERIGDILHMDHALRSLRAYLTTPAHDVQSPRTTFKLWMIVEQAMRNLYGFADSRGITFHPASVVTYVRITANEQEMLRVITNLLHNAVKYSWSRDSGTWVDVRLSEVDESLKLEIENFGVPIPPDEIESGLIFLFGFRSRLATDRGRVGTGIGLADASETLKRNGGQIDVRSRPAFPGGNADKMDPFLTTVIVTMPIVR
ncbi:MAG: PAS domain-containing sensor histidine kinase [Ardenticatenales bacterium]|nr:PAS domain-containing sensor histidine kinase [Ardenticatenales bacterium]